MLVTRPRDGAESTARRLVAAGHEAVFAPVLEIRPTGEPAPSGRFDAILVTSSNAVPALAEERARFAATPCFAVGRRTADRLRGAGYGSVTDAARDALALVEAVRRRFPPGAKLLHAAGRDRKAEPERSLGEAGYRLVIWECYLGEAARELPAAVIDGLRSGQVQAALHFSRRSAEVFRRLVEQNGLNGALSGTSHFCLSPDVAEGLRGLAGLKLSVAPSPDETSLLDLLGKAAAIPGSQPPQSGC